MEKYYYNSDKIIRLDIVDKKVNENYQWKPFKKGKHWWNKDQKEGFYTTNCYREEVFITNKVEEIINDNGKQRLVIDNVVYFRPFVKIYYENDFTFAENVETYKEAEEYAELFLEKNPNLKLLLTE